MPLPVRVAIAQFAYPLAYATQTADYYREPAPPDTDTSKPPSLLARLLSKPRIGALTNAIVSAHLMDLDLKLRAVLHRCAEEQTQILVLPEYSVPVEALRTLADAAKSSGIAIIAGSHTVRVTPAALGQYHALGLGEIASSPELFARKALSPVFLPDGSVVPRFKTSPSKWEPDLVRHVEPQAPLVLTINGRSVTVELKICIDALTQQTLDPKTELLLVAAFSPTSAPFDSLFTYALTREIPSVIANSAVFGGSRVTTADTATPAALAPLLVLTKRDEVLLIAELDLDQQFQKKGSAILPEPVRLLARAPLLYECVPDHADAIELIVGYRQKPDTLYEERVRAIAHRENVPATLREQAEILLASIASGTATPDDALTLIDCVPISRTAAPFWNRCEHSLEQAGKIVAGLYAEQSNAEAAEAMVRIAKQSSVVKQQCVPLDQYLPALVEDSFQSTAPFVDRDNERRKLDEILERTSIVVVQGLPGIGKRSLVAQVAQEKFPLAPVTSLHCVPGMTWMTFIKELGESTGLTREDLKAMAAMAKRRIARIVIVHGAEYILAESADPNTMKEFGKLLDDTGIKVVMLSSRVADVAFPVVSVSRLGFADEQRIFEYWCKVQGVQPDSTTLPHLHGYPLAAKFAARLLRDGAQDGLRRLKFIKELRREVIKVLLNDFPLGDAEKKGTSCT